jgi:hypothetical protein
MLLFSANDWIAASADICLQHQADLSVNCKPHYKHALRFPVVIITADS